MSAGQRAEADGGQVFQAGRDVIVNHAPASPARVSNLPPRNPYFVGREETLAAIRGALARGVVAIQPLHGIGGVGKSQTAVEYAHRHAADYRCTWRIPSEHPELIPGHLARLAAALDAPDFRTALSARSDWLLIFDNAESLQDLYPLLPSGGHVLITTRSTGCGGLGAAVRLDVLPRADSAALLRARVPAMSEAQADDLADLLGDLPLGLAQAAGYLEETGLPVADYLALIRTYDRTLFAEGDVVGYPHTISTVWGLSLRHLADHEPRASAALRGIAFLSPDAIPVGLVTGPVAAVESARIVGALVKHGLVERDGDTISVHRLLQAHLRHEAGHADLTAVLTRFRDVLESEDESANWRQAQRLALHLMTVLRYCRLGERGVEAALSALGDVVARLLRGPGVARVSRELRRVAEAMEQPSAAPDDRLDPALWRELRDVLREGTAFGALVLFVEAARDPDSDPDASPARLGAEVILALAEVAADLGQVKRANLARLRAVLSREGPRRARPEETCAPR